LELAEPQQLPVVVENMQLGLVPLAGFVGELLPGAVARLFPDQQVAGRKVAGLIVVGESVEGVGDRHEDLLAIQGLPGVT